jgi:hypothetical protein
MVGSLAYSSPDGKTVVTLEGAFVALIAARGGGVNSVGRARRRRYCPRCSTRVSRSANRCGYCRKLLPSSRLVAAAVATLLLSVLIAVAARVTGLL